MKRSKDDIQRTREALQALAKEEAQKQGMEIIETPADTRELLDDPPFAPPPAMDKHVDLQMMDGESWLDVHLNRMERDHARLDQDPGAASRDLMRLLSDLLLTDSEIPEQGRAWLGRALAQIANGKDAELALGLKRRRGKPPQIDRDNFAVWIESLVQIGLSQQKAAMAVSDFWNGLGGKEVAEIKTFIEPHADLRARRGRFARLIEARFHPGPVFDTPPESLEDAIKRGESLDQIMKQGETLEEEMERRKNLKPEELEGNNFLTLYPGTRLVQTIPTGVFRAAKVVE